MTPAPHLVERAYQMARSGQFRSMDDVRNQLQIEGYGSIDAHLDGSLIRKDLQQLIAKATATG